MSMLLIFLFVSLLLLYSIFLCGWLFFCRNNDSSPYARVSLLSSDSLSFFAVERVVDFLYSIRSVENPVFDISKVGVCKCTRRIFTDCVNVFGRISLNKNFLKKRYVGNWIDWNDLGLQDRRKIIDMHSDDMGLIKEQSIDIEGKEWHNPGLPVLYVDIKTKFLLLLQFP